MALTNDMGKHCTGKEKSVDWSRVVLKLTPADRLMLPLLTIIQSTCQSRNRELSSNRCRTDRIPRFKRETNNLRIKFKFGINPFSKWRQSLPLGKSRLIIISQSSGEKHLRCPKNVKIEFVLCFSISATAGDAVLEAKLRSQCFSQELFRIHKRTID